MRERVLVATQLLTEDPELSHILVPLADCCEVVLHLIRAQDPEEPALQLPHHPHLRKGISVVTAHGAKQTTVPRAFTSALEPLHH